MCIYTYMYVYLYVCLNEPYHQGGGWRRHDRRGLARRPRPCGRGSLPLVEIGAFYRAVLPCALTALSLRGGTLPFTVHIVRYG